MIAPMSQSEKAVIGSMILDPSCIDVVLQYVKGSEYFTDPFLGTCYKTLVRMHKNNQKIDLVTLKDAQLGIKNQMTRLASLVSEVDYVSNVEEYAKIVRDYYARRRLNILVKNINAMNTEKYLTPTDVITEIENEIKKLGSIIGGEEEDSSMDKLVEKVWVEYYKKKEKDSIGIIPTGFYDLDAIINGLEKGENIILAARPGMGKTSFALNIALNIAKNDKRVLIISLEMSKERLASRLLCLEGKIDVTRFKRGELQDDEYDRMARSATVVSKLPIIMLDKINNTIDIRSAIAKYSARDGLDLVIIDYLQLITDKIRGNKSRANEVGEIAKSIQQMAHYYEVPIITLSQLNREVEKRNNKRPMLSDLYESGDIEASADKVLFIYRDEEYNPDSNKIGIAEILIAKQRDGRKGIVELLWIDYCMKFENLERQMVIKYPNGGGKS